MKNDITKLIGGFGYLLAGIINEHREEIAEKMRKMQERAQEHTEDGRAFINEILEELHKHDESTDENPACGSDVESCSCECGACKTETTSFADGTQSKRNVRVMNVAPGMTAAIINSDPASPDFIRVSELHNILSMIPDEKFNKALAAINCEDKNSLNPQELAAFSKELGVPAIIIATEEDEDENDTEVESAPAEELQREKEQELNQPATEKKVIRVCKHSGDAPEAHKTTKNTASSRLPKDVRISCETHYVDFINDEETFAEIAKNPAHMKTILASRAEETIKNVLGKWLIQIDNVSVKDFIETHKVKVSLRLFVTKDDCADRCKTHFSGRSCGCMKA